MFHKLKCGSCRGSEYHSGPWSLGMAGGGGWKEVRAGTPKHA